MVYLVTSTYGINAVRTIFRIHILFITLIVFTVTPFTSNYAKLDIGQSYYRET